MSQQSNHTQHTQSGAFPSQQSSQTNPFTADLKGEFTSNFGTNTNAMSQIFKDGGFAGSNVGKWIAVGVLLLVVGGAAFYLMSEEPTDDLLPPEQTTTPTEGEKPAENTAATPTTETQPTAETPTTTETAPQENVATGPISLASPVDGDSRAYDETSGPARFSWEGGAGTIVFARNANFNPVYMRVPVSGNSYNFYNPYPGTWFWKVETQGGASETRRFTVEPAARRNFSIKEPATGATLAANGGAISWNADPERKVAFYRVEFSSDGKWTNPSYRFASSGESVQTQGMTAGQYQMRLGAFSEVAGRWEFTEPVSVTVQ